MMKQTSRKAILTGTTAILLSTSAAFAAEPATGSAAADQFRIDEIIVTGSKMGATNLQETPIAITAFSAEILEKTGIKDIRDLAGSTPNLMVAQNGAFAQLYIRGIGSNNTFAGSDPSTTVNMDGVYIARPGAVFNNFMDVERIEVLRGPQGTLYGRNAVGGTINVISRLPTNEFHAKVQGTVGNYNLFRGEGYISGPIIEDKLFASISAMGSKHNGYFENIVPSGNDRGSENTWGTRAQIRALPTDNLEIIVRADYLKDTGHFVGNQALLLPFRPTGATGPVDPVTESIRGDWHKVALDTPSVTDRFILGTSGEINYTISEAAVLKSLTAYRKSHLDYTSDTDATDLHRQITLQQELQHQFSQEFNLTGKIDALKYVAGLYYFQEHIDAYSTVTAYNTNRVTNPAPIVDTKAWAGFAQATYDITDKFSATAGIRYTDEKKDFDQYLNIFTQTTGVSLAGYPTHYLRSGKYKAWTPKFGLDYHVTEDVMLYASATKGFKSGGFNFSSANKSQGFAPETLWSYEAGFKSEFADHRVRFNGTGFYYDYKNLQVQSFLMPGVTDITNASNATVKGIELELQTRPIEGLDIGGSLTYLKAVYKDYPKAPIPGAPLVFDPVLNMNVAATMDASGNYLNSSPKWTYNLYAQYTMDFGDKGTAFVRGEYGFKARQFFTVVNDNVQTMPNYDLINASIGYTSPDQRWQVIAYGRNLSNTQYLVSTGSFTAVPAGTPGDPRTFGLRLSYAY
ncbi:TonB-dependent receptor [Govanella unica]|uniref:TonB-dependent receptor n=1 Tax=Govanella unica TaxID=2975056 RepID=A0A9X3Z7V9_9PROT|nr:TonB-dependent receptor [Govania unica]MDA5194404.1 TonB-dependent receptor [Govania unica]